MTDTPRADATLGAQFRRFLIVLVLALIIAALAELVLGPAARNYVDVLVMSMKTSRTRSCRECLQILDGAKEQWSLEERKPVGETPKVRDLFGKNNYIRSWLVCPAGGTYTINSIGTDPTCSLSSGQGHYLP